MRFGVLGPLQAGVGVRGLRLRALLSLLLLDAGRVVPTDRLIDGVYGEDPPKGAANALQSQVSRLRNMLPRGADGAPLVEFHPGGYRLAVDPDDVDVHRFTRLAREARGAALAEEHRRASRLFAEALAQWRGPALADVAELPFAGPQAARLEEQRASVFEDHVATRLALGEAAEVVAELRAHADAHPLRERAWALLVRALGNAGRSAEALAAFDTVRQTLAEELGTDPTPELAAAHLAVLRGETDAKTASEPAAPERWGMRHQFTTFVGREDDVRRVSALIDGRQLVTLVGPGGAGKTRLAVEVVDGYAGNAGFVDLSSLTETADIPQVILSTLEVREAGLRGTSTSPPTVERAMQRLENALSDRALLLVLDNCEHLVGPVAALVGRLLGAAPRLRILATSREPLGITGEALHRLWGLSLPSGEGEDAAADADHLRESAAVRLFVERGQDTDPGFVLGPHNVAAVLRICRRLDGLPLGIELAAARLRTLPVAEIARRLDDRFQLLSRGSRTAQPRHQTLRAVVEWSWDLLTPEEQRLCQGFTVFSGGADLAAVEAVCGVEDPEEILSSLVDKSLLEIDHGRYRMLDTVHAFGAERLADSGTAATLHAAHTTYFRTLAESAEPRLRSGEQLEWLARLDVERDNLHLAVRRALAAGEVGTAARMVAALSQFWWLRGMRWEASALAGEVYDAIGPEPPRDLMEEWTACFMLASLGRNEDDMVATRERVRYTTWEWIVAADEPPKYPFALYVFALTTGPASHTLEDLADLIATIGSRHGPWLHALTLIGSGTVARLRGEQEPEAVATLRTSLALFQQVGDRWGMSLAHSALGEELAAEGKPADGIVELNQALRLAHELRASVDVSDLLRTRGVLHLQRGDVANARTDFEAAVAGAQRAGDPENTAGARLGLADLTLREGDVARARALAQVALAECPTGWFVADEIREEIAGFLDSLDA